MSDELKSCPFCGCEAFLDGRQGEIVSCGNCGARSETDLWNNRPLEDKLRAENERLRSESKEFSDFILELGLIEDLGNPDAWEDEQEYKHVSSIAAKAREAMKEGK